MEEDSCIVGEWLRSLGLIHYTEAFLDNGYDDLEICKQIGHEDLDAIGVLQEDHRVEVLEAVRVLREEGGARVYFTLDPDYQATSGRGQSEACGPGFGDYDVAGPAEVLYAEGKQALVTYPGLQLLAILRDRLEEQGIDIGKFNQDPPHPELEELAQKFSVDLNTHFSHVLQSLQKLAAQPLSAKHEKMGHPMWWEPMSSHTLFSVIGHSHRSQPPPLPSCPAPTSNYVDPSTLDIGTVARPPVRSASEAKKIEDVASQNKENDKKKTSTLGRFFKNVTQRRSGRKHTYKPPDGDLSAGDITMSDEDRISLMIKVKEGKLSLAEAVDMVKKYEAQNRPPGVPSPSRSQETLEFPSFRKKSNSSSNKSDREILSFLKLRSQSQDYAAGSGMDTLASLASSRQSELAMDMEYGGSFLPRDVTRSSSLEATTLQYISPMMLRKHSHDCTFSAAHLAELRRQHMYSPFAKRKGSLEARQALQSHYDVGLLAQWSEQNGRHCGQPHPDAYPGWMLPHRSVTRTMHGRRFHSRSYEEISTLKKYLAQTTNDMRKQISHNDILHRQWWTSDFDPGGQSMNLTEPLDVNHTSQILQKSISPHTHESSCRTAEAPARTVILSENMQPCPDVATVRPSPDLCADTPIVRHSPDLNADTAVVRESPVEDTSPTGTLDSTTSEDFKDSKYGSSSTMSVGSDVSPVLDRKQQRYRNQLSRMQLGSSHVQNSAGEDCLSSDYDDQEDSGQRGGSSSDGTSSSLATQDACSYHDAASPTKSPARTTDAQADLFYASSPRRQKGSKKSHKRPRPKTLQELLARLGLQHLSSVFMTGGFTTLELFSDLDEDDLNDLSINSPQDRVKVLTAAQMLQNYEDTEQCSLAELGPPNTDQVSNHPGTALESLQEVVDGHTDSSVDSSSPSCTGDSSMSRHVISINNDNGRSPSSHTDKPVLVTFSGRGTEAMGGSPTCMKETCEAHICACPRSDPESPSAGHHSNHTASCPPPRPSKAPVIGPRPPRPKVPQRTVSLPTTSAAVARTTTGSPNHKEPQKILATSRRNKVSHVRDKV